MPARSDSRFSLAEWATIWAVVVIWGVNNAAGKLATAVLPPLFVGGVRFAIALVVLIPFIRPPFPPWRSFLPVMILMGPLHFGLVYWGFALAHNLSLFSVSLQLWIPITALFSWLLLGEVMPKIAIAGLGLAFAGVAYMTMDPRAAGDVKAVLVGLCASTIWALGTVLVRRLPPVRALKVQGCISLVAAPVLLTGAFLTSPHLAEQARATSALVWWSIVYAALVSSVGATAALFWLVQRREAGRFAPYLLTTPLVSAAFGVGFFGDVLTFHLIVGAAGTLAGVAIVALAERGRPTAETPETGAP
jgi:O-acetylserine/cysteine efflux transporter